MILRNIFRVVALLLIQVLVLHNLNLGAYTYPAFYIYFILLLPFETRGWVLLTSAFMLGLSVDFFTNTIGLNAAATVFMAFFRPAVIQLLTANKSYEPGMVPGIRDTGFGWFFTYSLLLIAVHHSMLFFLEVFTLHDFRQTLIRIAYSSIATLGLVLFAQLLFNKETKK